MGSGATKKFKKVAGSIPIIGPALTAGMPAENVEIPGVPAPNYQGDQDLLAGLAGQINRAYVNQRGATKDLYSQELQAGQGLIDQQTKDMISNLTTGKMGEDLREKYNQMGLLDSGAFNEALAQQFSPIQQQAQQQLLQQNMGQYGDLRDILGSQTESTIGLNTAGTQRQFGLEDWFRNAQLQRALAQAGANLSVQTGNQQAASDVLGSLVGGGSRVAAAGKGG